MSSKNQKKKRSYKIKSKHRSEQCQINKDHQKGVHIPLINSHRKALVDRKVKDYLMQWEWREDEQGEIVTNVNNEPVQMSYFVLQAEGKHADQCKFQGIKMCFDCDCFRHLKVLNIEEEDILLFLELILRSTLGYQQLLFSSWGECLAVNIRFKNLEMFRTDVHHALKSKHFLMIKDWKNCQFHISMDTKLVHDIRHKSNYPPWLTHFRTEIKEGKVKPGSIRIHCAQQNKSYTFDSKTLDRKRSNLLSSFQNTKYNWLIHLVWPYSGISWLELKEKFSTFLLKENQTNNPNSSDLIDSDIKWCIHILKKDFEEREEWLEAKKSKCYTCKSKQKHLLKCSSCLIVRYCNKSCQKAKWKEHQQKCLRFKLVSILI